MRGITRARYHRAIRHVEKNANAIKMQKMAESLLDNRSRDMWAESRKIMGRNNNLPCSIDGAKCDEDINNRFFYGKYNPLHNSVPYGNDKMNDIKYGIENDLFKRYHNDYVITVADVIKSVANLTQDKTDGEEGLMSDNIIHGTHSLYVLLTIIFNAMLIHGVCPDSMILGTMVPIRKNKKKSLCNSDNLSTTQCTFCMMETVNYYNFNRSNVYVLLSDATKAFA